MEIEYIKNIRLDEDVKKSLLAKQSIVHSFEKVSKDVLKNLNSQMKSEKISKSPIKNQQGGNSSLFFESASSPKMRSLIYEGKKNFVLRNKMDAFSQKKSNKNENRIPEIYLTEYSNQKSLRKKTLPSTTKSHNNKNFNEKNKILRFPTLTSISENELFKSELKKKRREIEIKNGYKKFEDFMIECEKFSDSMSQFTGNRLRKQLEFKSELIEKLEKKEKMDKKRSVGLIKHLLKKEISEIYLRKKFMNQGWEQISKKRVPSKFVIAKMLENPYLEIDDNGELNLKTTVNI